MSIAIKTIGIGHATAFNSAINIRHVMYSDKHIIGKTSFGLKNLDIFCTVPLPEGGALLSYSVSWRNFVGASQFFYEWATR